ncbi:hypothetical protein JK359_37240 [Streptomyces actinomycinicus]|uniref:Sel1 repeat family protein n=1 Tax=Streptomyces actinomycinicus TaxID=1695166 RepID=A0A937JU61_9ACTN|nr:hypothetical protein [Streptomyces actinomycinicus]MBL1087523.1 hypothetical protein [Streptomyces actinomycinicus]
MPNDFQLFFPTDADSLLAMLAADALGPRTVLWLNEAQHYLDGSADEAAAAALLRRLDADGPFVALATLWPDHDKALTTASTSSDDPHRQARALLSQAHYVHLPSSFAEHLDAVRHAVSHDASLASALNAGGADIAQVLAAGPQLVDHYEAPHSLYGIYGKALISAAMDAHRPGIIGPLPLTFLHDAAQGYLTGSERAAADPNTWFAGALTHAPILIKQITRPLQDVPCPSGMGALAGVVSLADYLQHHDRRTRWFLCPPATFWNAATRHLQSPDALAGLAYAAPVRHRLRHAAHLYCVAAEAGDPSALTRLAEMREGDGDQEEAEPLYVAACAGEPSGLAWLAERREEAGDQEAQRLYVAAADAGSTSSSKRLAERRGGAGDWEVAERLARHAGDSSGGLFARNGSSALTWLAEMREEAGDQEEAERLYRAAADAGDIALPQRTALKQRERPPSHGYGRNHARLPGANRKRTIPWHAWSRTAWSRSCAGRGWCRGPAAWDRVPRRRTGGNRPGPRRAGWCPLRPAGR